MKKQITWFLIFLISLLVIFLFVLGLQYKRLASSVTLPVSAEVEIEQNANDSTMSDIYLISSVDGKKIFFSSVKDLDYHRLNAVNYQNGYLYVITRTGGPEGYKQFPDTWTDTLKRIDSKGNEKEIYSYRGLIHQMSTDGKLFTFFERSSDLKHSKVILTDDSGKVLRTFSDKELGIKEESVGLEPIVSLEIGVWIRAFLGHEIIAVIQIDPEDFSHHIYQIVR